MPLCVHLFLQKMNSKNEAETCFSIHFLGTCVCCVQDREELERKPPGRHVSQCTVIESRMYHKQALAY